MVTTSLRPGGARMRRGMRIGHVLLILLCALPERASRSRPHATPRARRCVALVPLRGGGEDDAGPAYVPTPLEAAAPPVPAHTPRAPAVLGGVADARAGRSAKDRAAPSLLEQFEGMQRLAHRAQGPGAVGRANSRASSATHALRSSAPASTLDTIRARLMQLPTEEAEDDSVSLDSNEERSVDETGEAVQGYSDYQRRHSSSQSALGKLTSDQERAVDAVKAGHNIFLTGSAGTGKSYVLKHLIAALKRRHGNKAVHVTASTGAAAVLIGGTTLHAFAGIGLGKEDAATLVKKVYANKLTSHRWQRARALIIDEVSMIDSDLFDKVDYVARQLKTPGRPFGGLQLVVCGDFFQLPPVGPGSTGGKRFAFQSMAWTAAVDQTIELKRVMRQGEDKFVRVLNELRWGKVSAASAAALLMCQRQSPQWDDGVELTKLYPYNVNVRAENEKRLKSLPGELLTYEAQDSIKGRAASRQRLEALGVEKTLQLKVGAQVMCLKNLDVASGLVNGARGVVVGLAANATCDGGKLWPKVKFACGVEQVMVPEVWSVLEADSVVAERKQVPLSLAWAVSVHKCQGMTLDRVEASLSQAFDHGMVYVALSRVKSLQGLRLRGFAPSKATAHPDVVSFYRSLGCLPPMEADRAAFHAKNESLGELPLCEQQANFSAFNADPRAYDPSLDAVNYGGVQGSGEGPANGAPQGTGFEDMQEVPLEAMLDAARQDPRLDRSYALASRGAYQPAPERELASEGGQIGRRRQHEGARDAASSNPRKRSVSGHAQGLVGKQVHEAVVAAAAQLNTARSHPSSAAVLSPSSTLPEPTAPWRHPVPGGSAPERPAADSATGSAHANRLNKQIQEWRQGFLRSRLLPTSHKAHVPSLPNHQPVSQSPHADENDCTREQASVGGVEASMADAQELPSQIEGVMGSSLAHGHHEHESSLPQSAYLSSVPDRHSRGAPGTTGAGGSIERRRSRTNEAFTATDANDRLPSSLLGSHAAGGGGAWSVREEALDQAAWRHKRPRHTQPISYSCASTGSASLAHGRVHEFAPASGLTFKA